MRAIRLGIGMAVLVALIGLVTPSTAGAASIVCPNNIGFNQPIGDNVTPSLGCELGSDNNDSEPTVNALDSMFGITTWEELARADITGTTGVLCATVVAGCTNSTGWSYTGLTITSLMLVLKGGASASPDDYVGYLLPVGTTLINFTTPFANPGNGNAKDISHYTIYTAEELIPDTHTTVPEPASLMLLGSGIIGLASRFRRRQPR